jgi:hypothetical protein
MLGITSVFPIPQQLQGYDVDEAFMTEGVDTAEIKLGVDGRKSAGYIPQLKKVRIKLQADSPSNDMFEEWYAAQEAAQETFDANAVIRVPGVSKVYTCTKGSLTRYPPFADAKKTLQAREYEITFEQIIPAPLG